MNKSIKNFIDNMTRGKIVRAPKPPAPPGARSFQAEPPPKKAISSEFREYIDDSIQIDDETTVLRGSGSGKIYLGLIKSLRLIGFSWDEIEDILKDA